MRACRSQLKIMIILLAAKTIGRRAGFVHCRPRKELAKGPQNARPSTWAASFGAQAAGE